jgi:hypothetical protein
MADDLAAGFQSVDRASDFEVFAWAHSLPGIA